MHPALRCSLLGTVLMGLAGHAQGPDPFDLLLANARIVDGTGGPWYRGDVGIRGGRIVAIGDLGGRQSGRTIEVGGRVVSPGFIDLMGGSSVPLLRDPSSAESKLRQGITTMLVGEGGSVAPQNERTAGAAQAPEWRTFDEYFRLLEQAGIPLNVVHNVGAAQARRYVIGDEDRTPAPDELAQMKALVAQAMRDGAIGLSTALIYPPGTYAKTEEIVELAKVAAEHGGVYFTHMRNESNRVLEAIAESIHIGEAAGLPVQIYHLKAAGQENWPLMPKALEMIRRARDRGADVTADIYPYIRNGIGLGSFIHPRHYARGRDPFAQTLGDPKVRRDLRREIETTSDWENWYRHVGKNWDNVLIVRVPDGTDQRFVGMSVQEAARARGVHAWTAFFDLVQAGEVTVNPQSMNEEQKRLALRAEFVMIDTDAAPVNPATTQSAHPRAFGTFPRVLAKYVREEKVISLENAIYKMTALAANRLQLYTRGRIAPGMIADLVVFDPHRIRDTATFTKPLSYSEGIDYLIVGGQLVIDDGKVTGARPGEVIRANRQGREATPRAWSLVPGRPDVAPSGSARRADRGQSLP